MAPVKAPRTRQFRRTGWPSEGQKRTLCPTGIRRARFPAGPLAGRGKTLANWATVTLPREIARRLWDTPHPSRREQYQRPHFETFFRSLLDTQSHIYAPKWRPQLMKHICSLPDETRRCMRQELELVD